MTVDDWQQLPVGVVAKPRLGGNYKNTPAITARPLVKMGNITRINMDVSKLEYIPDSQEVLEEHRLRFGDVLLNTRNTLDLVGKVSIWRDELPLAYYNSNILRLEFNPRYCGSSEYFGYALNTSKSVDAIRALATGTTSVAAVYTRDLLKLSIPVPPNDEQRSIVEALRDVDRLVASRAGVLAKRRAIKQSAMQELLTGRTRLPGFSSSWTTLRVAAASHLKARIGWQGLTTDEYRVSGEYRLVGGTEFLDGRVSWDTTPYVDKWRFDQDPNIQLQVGDVLVTKDGTIGKVALVDVLPGPTTLNSGVFVVRPKRDAYDSRFLSCMLRSRAFDEFVAGLSAGSTINHLYQKDLVTLTFTVPSDLAEQRAIATVALDADAEIDALERRLDTTRAIKQGMMRELLTGRTRLPVDKKDAA